MDNLSPRPIKVAHSPDSDDAFMFYAIKKQKINCLDYQFEFASDEISILNQKALDGQDEYQIVALSFATLFKLEDEYELMPTGCSFGGRDYGPKIVTTEDGLLHFACNEQKTIRIAVPGKNTTAFLTAQAYLKETYPKHQFEFIECSYDAVFNLLENKNVDSSLLIHESQLKFQELGYELIVDLGTWWYKKTKGLNMPLGCNAIKKDLGETRIKELNELLHKSILWGKENFEETLEYSRKFAENNLDDDMASKYLDMYVNDTTLMLTNDDLKSIEILRELS